MCRIKEDTKELSKIIDMKPEEIEKQLNQKKLSKWNLVKRN